MERIWPSGVESVLLSQNCSLNPCSARVQADAAGNAKALWDVGRAAGLAAAVVAAGVATSALAIDLDLAVAGALVAAGASLLQGGGKADAKGASPC